MFAIRSAEESLTRNWDIASQTNRFVDYMKTCTPWNDRIELVVFQEMEDRRKLQKEYFDKEEAKRLKKLLSKQPKETCDG